MHDDATDEHRLTVGAPGLEMSAAAPPVKPVRDELPEGVLPKAGIPMSTSVGVVMAMAMAQAGYNLAQGLVSVGLPLPFAAGFPILLETVAAGFAVQDMRDRRRGHTSDLMRGATYGFLVLSAAVNGIVGWTSYGWAGLIEILPPLVLAAVIHIHGERATHAFKSRSVLSSAWRIRHLEKARSESVLEVLPLLLGKDASGRAALDLIQRRMASQTLTPGEALIAAKYHDRNSRALGESELRYLELVAATVWGDSPPASPDLAAQPRRGLAATSPGVAGEPRHHLAAGSPGTSPDLADGSPSNLASEPRRTSPAPRRVTDTKLAEIISEVRREKPKAGEPTIRAVLDERRLEVPRAQLRDALKVTPPYGTSPADSPRSVAASRREGQ